MNQKTVYVILPHTLGTIAPEIYGHFAEHLGGVINSGIWVGKDSSVPNIGGFRKELVEKLKAIHPPVVRWPGGCFAEEYDWRDGIGPDRPRTWNHWRTLEGHVEPNDVGTHEFIDFCEQVGAKPFFAANLTSTTPLHIRNWMDYCLSPRGSTKFAMEREANGHPEPFDIPYWGVGNENYVAGGDMDPEFYANECRRYTETMRVIGPKLTYIACGAAGRHHYSWANTVAAHLQKSARKTIKGFSLHHYCADPYGSHCLEFNEEEWDWLMVDANTMEEVILRNWCILRTHGADEQMRLVVDEWGCWHKEGCGPSNGLKELEQQSTMREAMVTALTLNIFNRHCDKVMMANVAQLVNNLHALFLADGEHCITTPTYHVFDMYKQHQGARAVDTVVTNNEQFNQSVSVSASEKDGKLLITIGNLSCKEDAEITLDFVGSRAAGVIRGTLLHHEDMHAHNTFEAPDVVKPADFAFDPAKPIRIPKAGIVALELQLA